MLHPLKMPPDRLLPVGGKQATDMVLETMGFRPTDNTNDDVM